jgi:hypothetical protein
MLRLFQAGLVAAPIQFIAVGLETLVAVLSAQHGLIAPALLAVSPDSDFQSDAIFPLLIWVYLLTALGLALTCDRFIFLTAARIRHASRLMRPTEPDHAAKTLLVLLWLTAIGFAVMALRSPPYPLLEAARYIGCTCAASIAWSGLMSIGAASFGANAQAASRSFWRPQAAVGCCERTGLETAVIDARSRYRSRSPTMH